MLYNHSGNYHEQFIDFQQENNADENINDFRKKIFFYIFTTCETY